jgi:homocysteine S-methyltransferase
LKFDQKKFLLDGPMGTEIERRGGNTNLPLWSAQALIDNPDLVYEIHCDYIKTGADIITTNTFRTQPWTLQKTGLPFSKARELTQLAVDLAIESRKNTGDCLIAGSISPLEDCYKPELVPANKILVTEHKKHIKNLVDGGIDVFLSETMNTYREAKVVYELLQEYSNIPIILSFTVNDQGTILGGDSLDTINNFFKLEEVIISINCSSVIGTTKALEKLTRLQVPNIGFYPNFGNFERQAWTSIMNDSSLIDEIHLFMYSWIKNAKLIGTCCGATPVDTKRLFEFIHAAPNGSKKG